MTTLQSRTPRQAPPSNFGNLHPLELPGSRAYPPSGGGPGAGGKGRKSGSYSRFVWAMRVVLPSVALVLLGLILVWPQLSIKEEGFSLGFSSVSTDRLDALSMINARYFGTDESNQPFTVTADTATEEDPGLTLVRLDNPKADIALKDGTWLVLSSNLGFYQQKANTLDLVGEVNLFHDGGYEIGTGAATVELKKGLAGGDEPVVGHGPFGELHADGFRLIDKGKRIFFLGKVRVTLYPGAQKQLPSAGKTRTAPGRAALGTPSESETQ